MIPIIASIILQFALLPPVTVACRPIINETEPIKQNLTKHVIGYWHTDTHWYQSVQEMWTEPNKPGVQVKNYIIEYHK